MVDIVIPPIYKSARFNKNARGPKNRILKGEIIHIRKARMQNNPKQQRKNDKPNAKTFIILVDYNEKTKELLNKKVEIRII